MEDNLQPLYRLQNRTIKSVMYGKRFLVLKTHDFKQFEVKICYGGDDAYLTLELFDNTPEWARLPKSPEMTLEEYMACASEEESNER